MNYEEVVLFEGRVPYVLCLLGKRFGSMFLGIGFLLALWDSWTLRIKVTNQRVIFTHGLISRRVDQVEFYRVTDVGLEQSIVGRIFNFGLVKLDLQEARADYATVPLYNPIKWSEWFRNSVKTERLRTRAVAPALVA